MSTLWMLLSCAARQGAVQPPGEGLIGMRYRAIDEGLVVLEVIPGMGAAAAGLVPGDLVVGVEGADAVSAQTITGPAGTWVDLRVRGPLGGEERLLHVERRPPAGEPPGEVWPAEVRALREALRGDDPRRATAAAQAAAATGFGGMDPGRALGASLRAALGEPEVARAACEVLAHYDDPSGAVDREVGIVLAGLGDERATAHLLRAEERRPPDVAGDGWTGDLGGSPVARSTLSLALWDAGQQERAIELGRALLQTSRQPQLEQGLGMASLQATGELRARLPPVENLRSTTLSGDAFELRSDGDQPLVMAFWATWCGPCRQELPELQALSERHPKVRFVAVSVDQGGDPEDLRRFADKLGLTLPIVHEERWGERFEVGGIPAIRVFGPEGDLRYSSRGYSPAGIARLEAALGVGASQEGVPLGPIWSAGTVQLRAFAGVAGAAGLVVDQDEVVLGVRTGPPVRVDAGTGEVAAPGSGAGGVADRVVLLDGPVAADPGGFLLRAWDGEGALRWMRTTPSPVRDLAVLDDRLVVATRDELLELDAQGAVLSRQDVALLDLEPTEGGLWAVDGERRLWLSLGADGLAVEERGAAPGSACVDVAGDVGSEVALQLVAGRFGPQGAPRVVATRQDGMVIGLDGEGAPAFTLDLDRVPYLGVLDTDGDGQDELLVAVAGQGLATLELSLP